MHYFTKKTFYWFIFLAFIQLAFTACSSTQGSEASAWEFKLKQVKGELSLDSIIDQLNLGSCKYKFIPGLSVGHDEECVIFVSGGTIHVHSSLSSADVKIICKAWFIPSDRTTEEQINDWQLKYGNGILESSH